MRVLITESWLFASSVLISIGLVSGSVVVVAIGMLILGTGGAARLWSRLSLEEVRVRRAVSEHRLYVGETVDVTLTVENGKPIPVPWMEVQTTLPRGMQVIGGRTHLGATGSVVLDRSTSLGRKDRIVWPVQLRALRRGYFRVGPTRLRSGDIFGFFEREAMTGFPPDTIVVYPRTYTLPELGLDSERPFGDLRGGNRIYEDPSRVIGTRDYQQGDPMKRIDWKATARVMRLQSRLYEPSRTESVVIVLNIPTFQQPWQGSDPVLLERGVSLAASLAHAYSDLGSSVGLIANGSFPDADRPIRIGVSNHPWQLNRLLEALAMVTSFTTSRMSEELESKSPPLPVGATLLVIAAVMTEDLAATLMRLRGEGYAIHVVKTSAPPWSAELGAIGVTEMAPVMQRFEAEMQRQGLPVGTAADDAAEQALGMRVTA
ncbi:MAG: DUF58 domain-containing protein [Chloroflexi bacterium]|nr:DUF58 domain-containing protein [Chloroflexota bacterium]